MNERRILFVYTNIRVAKANYYSHGLGSIVAVLKQHEYNVNIFNLYDFDEEERRKLSEFISHFKPQIIGFTCVASQYRFIRRIADYIKKSFPHIIVVIGGVHPTLLPNMLLEAKGIDYLFRGEAEHTFLDFCTRFYEGGDVTEVKGLAHVTSNGELILNETLPLDRDLDSLPEPDRESFKYEDIVKATGGQADFVFNRGCPYNCSFCSNHALAKVYGLEHMISRTRSVDLAIKEIIHVTQKYDVKLVWIHDEIMGVNKPWLMDFCREYKKHIDIPFTCFQRANLVDEAKIAALKEAGCIGVNLGVESGNDFIRNYLMNRQISKEQIIEAFRICDKFGMNTTAANMIGLPFETVDMVFDTIALNRIILPTFNVVGIFYPYPGTKLAFLCKELGLIDEKKALSEDFVERKQGSILKLPLTDEQLNWFRRNWGRLIYRDFGTVLRHPKRLFFDKLSGKIRRKLGISNA
ncbi:MAG: radical SAM protein [Anaerolineae bacterium]